VAIYIEPNRQLIDKTMKNSTALHGITEVAGPDACLNPPMIFLESDGAFEGNRAVNQVHN
jgi:hypothetical protein